MDVSGIGAAGVGGASGIQNPPATWSGASRRLGGSGAVGRMQASIGAASQLLGMQPQDLIRQLGGGQSLSAVAASKGVSGASLMSTLTRAVASAAPQGSQPLGGDLLQTVAARIAGATGLPPGFSLGTAAG